MTNPGADTPKLASQTGAQSVGGNKSVLFSVAAAFSDPLNEALTYRASLATGGALPSWLTFNPQTRRFPEPPRPRRRWCRSR